MKEWGKRYLQPAAEWFGFRFPDRIVRVTYCSAPLLPLAFLAHICSPQCPLLVLCSSLVICTAMHLTSDALDHQPLRAG